MNTVFEKIYQIVRAVPFGRVSTYGQIALLVGNPHLARAVGYALNRSPKDVPCHRIVNRFGGLSSAFSPMGYETHRLLLELEGITFNENGSVDLNKHMWYGETEDIRMKNNLDILKRDYARLLIREGLNIQKGQRLVINCPVDCAAFARLCADEAYAAGCREVLMRWSDDYLARIKYLYAEDSVFDDVNEWDVLMADTVSAEGAAWLAIHASDPENLKDVNPDRIRRVQIASGNAMEAFRQREMRNEFPWCVASIPTEQWAKTVFPGLDSETATEKLWYEILRACRVDGGDAVANWKAHSASLRQHVNILNEYHFKSLHYANSIGTDLTVELPENHFWSGGTEKCTAGTEFSANIPTEEIFTLPRRDGVNGTVVASKPLCHNGNIIDGFRFILKDGKITEIHAKQGETILRDACSVDEGASFFGEVALVPYDSPISNSGILFYNTLFDENASCHFAFGEAYPCLHGAEKMTEEELKSAGVNFSMTHVDFMVGTEDLSIIGTTYDGREIPVFVNGNFAL